MSIETQTGDRGQLTHREAESVIIHDNSSFFRISTQVEKVVEHLPEFVTVSRTRFNFKNHPDINHFTEEEHTKGLYLKAILDLDNFDYPHGDVPQSSIFAVSTPENTAITVGRLNLLQDRKLAFEPSRLHVGPAAQRDMAMSIWQAAQIPEIFAALESANDFQSYAIYLTREGHIPDIHTPLFDHWNFDLPFTIAHVEHSKAENHFGRASKICSINFEGLDPSLVSTLVIIDNTASGMQHVATLESFISYLKRKNGKTDHFRKLVVVSPLLTLYGAANISLAAAELGVTCTFVCSEAILGCNSPERYYSPVQNNQSLIARPELLPILDHTLGEAFGKACARCNWTASFAARDYALKQSDDELAKYGVNNQKLQKLGSLITVDKIRDMGINPQILIPYSTYFSAYMRGELDLLKQALTK